MSDRDPSNAFSSHWKTCLLSSSHHRPEESASQLYSHVAFMYLMVNWWETDREQGRITFESLSTITLSETPGLWSARFHLSLWSVCWFVCNKRCQKWEAPENIMHSSCTQTTLLLPAGQRSVQPPALQLGWHHGWNLKFTSFEWLIIHCFLTEPLCSIMGSCLWHLYDTWSVNNSIEVHFTFHWFHFHLSVNICKRTHGDA